jgi:hypothetical protein
VKVACGVKGKAAWEGRDERLFCALFAEDGAYHNTPFAVQRGHARGRLRLRKTCS